MEQKARRLGGRSARVRSAVLEAALDELAERGPADYRVEGVAARAGVNKTTIYRRWGTKEELLADALTSSPPDSAPPADTGSLRGDLIAYGESFRSYYLSERAVAISRALTATSDPTLIAIRHAVYEIRRAALGEVFDRAVARGELPDQPPADLVTDLLFGTMFRVLLRGPDLPRDYVSSLADLVLNGLLPRVSPPDGD